MKIYIKILVRRYKDFFKIYKAFLQQKPYAIPNTTTNLSDNVTKFLPQIPTYHLIIAWNIHMYNDY